MGSPKALCLAAPLLLMGAGCASTIVSAPRPAEIAQVRPGMNRTQVLNLLGLPNQVEKQISKEGGVTWVWTYHFDAYTGVSLAMPVTPIQIPTGRPNDRDSARIFWSPEGTVAEVLLPQEQR